MKSKEKKMWQSFRKKLLITIVSLLILLLLIAGFVLKSYAPTTIDYQTFNTLLKNNMVDEATLGDRYVIVKSGSQEFRIPKELVDLTELYKHVPVKVQEDYTYVYNGAILLILAFFVGYLIYYLSRQKREPIPVQHQIQIAPANEVEEGFEIRPEVSHLTFDDVAGIAEVKEELEEIIDFLKNPKKYLDFGVRMPKGVLLVGPPGVGKTLIAKAVAGEAGVPFFYQSGSAFVQIYVGMGAKRVRELFKKAKQMSPSIIFIDEIDAVGKARGGMRNDEREATLNQLLTEMDGFKDSSEVIVIGATNKIEVLDEALLRPGRFDRRIFVSLPNREDRAKILEIYLKKIPHNVDIEQLAAATVGFSGAALSSLVNEAALNAIRQGRKIVTMEDFEAVKRKVIFGKKKVATLSEREKEVQAIYQVAKGMVAYWFDHPFEKISLFGSDFQEIDREILSKSDLLVKLKVLLAGYVALKVIFGEEFSICAEDVKRAKLLAEEMVSHYAMGDRIFGDMNDVERVVEEILGELREFFGSKKEQLQELSKLVQERESITKKEIAEVLGGVF